MTGDQPRLLSRPVGVEWAGWRTDTATLRRAGWNLAVEHEAHSDRYRLLMQHPDMRLHAISEPAMFMLRQLPPEFPVFRVVRVAPSLHVVELPGLSWQGFEAIDAQPQYTSKRITRIEDTNIFAPFRVKAEELVVNRADMTVVEHLEAIRALQDPEQRRIRERMLREDSPQSAPHRDVVVQLVEYRRAS